MFHIPYRTEKNKGKHETIYEYAEREFDSFEEVPFHQVDSLILAELCYLDFSIFFEKNKKDWIPLSFMYKKECFNDLFQYTIFTAKDQKLFTSLCASPRYRDIKIGRYVTKYDVETQEQFSAVTFLLPTGQYVCGYRGTDVGVVGWKEDFNMLYLSPVPSQISAVRYLKEVSSEVNGSLILLGHSKGGNLAVYAALFAGKQIEPRIDKVYNLDGPGFQEDVLDVLKNSKVKDKIIKIMPEGSFIGVILNTVEHTIWIKSNRIGFMQHDAHAWLSENCTFVTSKGVTAPVRHMDQRFHSLTNHLSMEERKVAIDTVFSILQDLNAEKLSDLAPLLVKENERIRMALRDLDEETANCIKECFRQFMKISFASVVGKREDSEKDTGIPSKKTDTFR